MDPVVGAMEVALINSTIGILVSKLNTMIEKDNKLRKELKRELHNIMCEMGMIKEAVKMHAQSKHLWWWILEIQELAYDIEDKIDEFSDRVTCRPEAGFWARKLHNLKTKDTRAKFAEQIQELKERATNAYKRKDTYLAGAGAATSASELKPAGPSSFNPYIFIPEDELVGIAEPKKELRKLLEFGAAGGEAEQLRVVSVVGCRGLGKTTLAKVVFDSFDDVPCRAWVVASDCKDVRALLQEIYSKLPGEKEDTTTSSLAELGKYLCAHLGEQQKYLIGIDDIQTEVWEAVKFSFPRNKNGRIIVTTSIQSIAEEWISHGGFVYKMQALNEVHSRALLLKQVRGSCIESSSDFGGSEIILKKCDGLPLAIVNIAQLLKKPDSRTSAHCTKMCRDLGYYLQDGTLSRMKNVLIHSYDTLPGHDLRTCLLSVSIFPENHQIKRKSLIRRWVAEGLVVEDVRRGPEDVACDYFEKLIDRNVIQPLHTSNNSAVKTCQVHGIVLDFIVHKSASENFITFIHNDELTACKKPSCVRRLSLHKSTAKTVEVVKIDLSRIRSLTIFDHVGVYIDFEKCKLLRVLDLEKCRELKESDIQNICKLLKLKYLSLRGTNVTEIPREISNLKYLETLDIRETNVSILPIEVLNLPGLTHLFGRFKLPCELNQVREGHNRLQTFFSENSRLQTLAGFVIDENRGFQHIILHTRKLKKVKVWSEGTPSTDSLDLLISSLQKRFLGTGTDALQSLSIDFGNRSIDFLDSPTIRCVLTSIRLHGKLTKLPDFIKSLKDLELHLSSTALSDACLLELQRLDGLLYLKLVEYGSEFDNRNLRIESDGFPNLQRLCIQALNKLPEMEIVEGAMQRLTSLQLLCKDISGFPLDYISHIDGLKEVTLVTTVSPDKRKAWEKASKMHKNKPEIIIVTPTTRAI